MGSENYFSKYYPVINDYTADLVDALAPASGPDVRHFIAAHAGLVELLLFNERITTTQARVISDIFISMLQDHFSKCLSKEYIDLIPDAHSEIRSEISKIIAGPLQINVRSPLALNGMAQVAKYLCNKVPTPDGCYDSIISILQQFRLEIS